jgi:sulfur carrier protein
MIVVLNGSETEFSEGSTVADAVDRAGAAGEPRGVAVALDGEVVRKAEWGETALRGGQTVEVVRAVQGG